MLENDGAKGWKRRIAIKEMTTWDEIPETFAHLLEVDNEAIEKNVEKKAGVGLTGIRGVRRILSGTEGVSGKIGDFSIFPAGGPILLFKIAMGKVVTVCPDPTNHPTVFQHTITLLDAIPYGTARGLAIRADRDVRILDNKGCVIQELGFNSSVETGEVKGNITILGKNQVEGEDVFPAKSKKLPYEHFQSEFILGEGEAKLAGFEFTLGNVYKDNYYGNSRDRLGFIPNGHREVKGKMKWDVVGSLDAYDDFLNNADKSLIATWTGPLIDNSIHFSFQLNFPKLHYTGPNAPGSGGPEVPPLEVPFQAKVDEDADAQEFKLIIVNDEEQIGEPEA